MPKKEQENYDDDNIPTKNNDQQINIQVDIDDTIAQGVYTNLAITNFNVEEFVLDFIYLQPHVAKGRIRSRMILSPRNAKRLAQVLATNIQLYEEKFGPLLDHPHPAPGIQLSIN